MYFDITIDDKPAGRIVMGLVSRHGCTSTCYLRAAAAQPPRVVQGGGLLLSARPCAHRFLHPSHLNEMQYGATVPKTVENFVSGMRGPGCRPILLPGWCMAGQPAQLPTADLIHSAPAPQACHLIMCPPSPPWPAPALQRALCTGEKGDGKSGKPLHYKARSPVGVPRAWAAVGREQRCPEHMRLGSCT